MGSTLGFGKHLCHCFWHSAQPGVCCTFSPLAIQSEGHGWTQTPGATSRHQLNKHWAQLNMWRNPLLWGNTLLFCKHHTPLHTHMPRLSIWQFWLSLTLPGEPQAAYFPIQYWEESHSDTYVCLGLRNSFSWQVFVSFCRQALLFACRTPGCIHSELVALIRLGSPWDHPGITLIQALRGHIVHPGWSAVRWGQPRLSWACPLG